MELNIIALWIYLGFLFGFNIGVYRSILLTIMIGILTTEVFTVNIGITISFIITCILYNYYILTKYIKNKKE